MLVWILNTTAGNWVISAETLASIPKLINIPRITPQGTINILLPCSTSLAYL